MNPVKPGARIKGAYWPEPVEVKLVEEEGSYVRIVGVTTLSHDHVDQLIPCEVLLLFYSYMV